MREHAVRAARAFRLGEAAGGHEAFTGLVDRLSAELTAGRLTPLTVLPVLERVLDAQLRGDTLFLADLLEHELAPLIG